MSQWLVFAKFHNDFSSQQACINVKDITAPANRQFDTDTFLFSDSDNLLSLCSRSTKERD